MRNQRSSSKGPINPSKAPTDPINELRALRDHARNACRTGDVRKARFRLLESIEFGKSLIDKGETRAEVRRIILNGFLDAGILAKESGRANDAIGFYKNGVKLCDRFLARGETEVGVRWDILTLHLALGVAYCQCERFERSMDPLLRGIKLAEDFLAQIDEMHTEIQGLLIRFFYFAGRAASELGKLSDTAKFFRSGIHLGEDLRSQREIASVVREDLLDFLVHTCTTAGLWIESQFDEELDVYRRCIDLCQDMLNQGDTDAEVRWKVLHIHLRASLSFGRAERCGLLDLHSRSALDRVSASLDLLKRGIAIGERFLAQGETHSVIRQELAKLLINAGSAAHQLGRPSWEQQRLASFQVAYGLDSWEEWRANVSDDIPTIFQAKIRRAHGGSFIFGGPTDETRIIAQYPSRRSYTAWRSFLFGLLLRQSGLDLGHLSPAERSERLWLAEILLLLLQAENNALLPNACDSPPFVGPTALDKAARRLWGDWLDDPAPPSWSPDRLARLRAQLATQTWRTWLRAPLARWRGHRSLKRVEQTLHLTGQPSALSHLPSTRSLADWLAHALAESVQLPKCLDQPGSILLGSLYARYRHADLTLITDWRKAPPWAAGGAVLPVVFARTGYEHWIGGRPRITLNGWLTQFPCWIEVDNEVANSDAPGVAAPLEALAAGDSAPLASLLSVAWSDALRLAGQLSDLLAGLGVVESNKVRTPGALGPAQSVAGHHLHTQALDQILDAVLLGRSPLATELIAYLERAVPAPPNGLDSLTAKRRLGRAIALHPGPRLQQELAARIQSWGRRVIVDALREHDAINLWRVLETSRIALNGLHLKPPDEKSIAKTAQLVTQTVIDNVKVHRPGKVWPPLTVWRTSLEKDLKHTNGSLEACYTRLRKGEAIAQPFFDPKSGRCRMLWLDSAQAALRLIDLPVDCASPAWRGPDGVLTAWESWVKQRGVQPARAARCMPDLWARTRQAPAVMAFVAALNSEARRAQVRRIVLLLPAPLAQLPWEALAGSDWPPGLIERAATLSRWRQPADSSSNDDAEPPWVLYDSDPKSVLLGQAQAEGMASNLGCEPWPSCAELTAHDLMAVLSTGRGGHLVMHGEYRVGDPYRSGLYPSAGEFLPLWAACARPIPGGVYSLAACNAALSGYATADLLGPVGIAPALVATGADRVTGPLWCVDSLAAWVFFDLDHALAIAHPQLTAAARLPQTQAAMRVFPGERLKEMMRGALGRERFEQEQTNHPLLHESFPFENPVHWASFVVIGEG